MKRLSYGLFALAFFLTLSVANAQTFRGTINGTVTDPSGAVVPNAQVKATEVATGIDHNTVATSDGQFAFQDIPVGAYKVTITASGFATMTVDKVQVLAGSIYTLPVKLTVAKEVTTIEVSAAALAVDTTTSTQTQTIESQVVQDIPLNGRDFSQLIAENPGYGGYSVGGFGSLNGTRPNQMNWQIDGVDNNDFWHNIPAVNQGGVSGIAGVILPIDSIDEFSAQTQNGAEAGRNAGGTVNLVMKSGANGIHGTAYFYERNEAWSAASPFFIPSAQNPNAPKLRNLNYGGSVGGPILKDKAFYFLTFEKQQYIIGLSGLATEPSDAWINKSLAVLAAHGIPESSLSAKLIGPSGFWPRSLIGGLPGTINNFFSPIASTGYSYNGTMKFDFNLTEKHHLSAHWFGGQGSQTAPLGGSPALGTASSNLKDYFEVAPIHVYNYSVILNSTFSPRLTNQVLVGVNYFNQIFNDFNNSFDTKALGLFLSPDATNNGVPIHGAPNIAITGFEQIGLTPPEGRNDITGHLTDVVSYIVGKHQLRFGGEFRQARVNEFYHRRGTGKFVFDGTQGPWAADAIDTPTKALADFLAGDVSSSAIAVGNPERFVQVNAYNLYFQDAWQLTRKLNLNLGLRYEYFGPLHSDRKDLAVFIPGKGLVVQGNGISSIFPPNRNDFAPRFGFAYQPTAKGDFVVRGGAGIFFDQINMNPFLDFRPPIAAASGIQGNPFGAFPVSTYSTNRLGQTSYNWQTITAGGNPVFLGVTPCTDPLCTTTPGQDLFTVSQNFRTPHFATYNLQVEKGFGKSSVLQVGYVGSEGRKLNVVTNINQPNNLGVFPFPNFGSILQLNSVGTSNYNALQTSFKVRSWHGLTSTFGYTWSHTLDEISEYRAVIADATNNVKLDYGNGDYDTRHLFTVAMTYDIPGSSHGPKFLTHGWEVSSLMNWHSGQPYDEVLSGLSLIGDPFAGVSHNFSAAGGGTLWINPTAFCAAGAGTCPTGPIVAGNALGNVSRNKFHGPGYGDVDFSVFKNISVTERLKIQLRAEMFNLFNRVNLASGPGSVPTGGCTPQGASGVCAAPGSPAYAGFGLVSDTIGDFNGAPGIGPGEAFNMQLAIKIIF
ncbi:MAG TPA: carboxypeptidase regulatory-like domain-containing protein [Candidatus Angelobacter sp.]